MKKIKEIKDIQSVEQLWTYFEDNRHLLDKKDDSFITKLVNDWDDGVMSKKLEELYLSSLADQIKQIDPSQKKEDICQEIYKIILGEEEEDEYIGTSDSSDSWDDIDYWTNYVQQPYG